MEKKTKHRILGIFVTLGLIIILLPLFQGGSDLPSETKVVKAPPFPDQSVQVNTPTVQVAEEQTVIPVPTPNQSAENDTADAQDMLGVARPSVVNDVSTETTSTPTVETDTPAKVADVEPAMSAEEDDFKTQPTTAAPSQPATTTTAVNVANATDSVSSNDVSAEKGAPARTVKNVKVAQAAKKSLAVTKQTRVSKSKPLAANTPIKDNGLFELKNAAWVIQIGSFKNKANALRLVNQLRANGYRAFIQQTSSGFGDSTRVFVGPENKRNSARALANRLESDMHIRGIVISYKPLTL